jgi:two-component system, OmpR family, response regulator
MMYAEEGKKSKVLIADWDRSYALTLAAALHRVGFQAATAFNGLQAIDKASTFTPDLLVIETYLGRLSGIQAAARIQGASPECKVLLVGTEASARAIAASAPRDLVYCYLQKPNNATHILSLTGACWSFHGPTAQEWPTIHSTQAYGGFSALPAVRGNADAGVHSAVL